MKKIAELLRKCGRFFLVVDNSEYYSPLPGVYAVPPPPEDINPPD